MTIVLIVAISAGVGALVVIFLAYKCIIAAPSRKRTPLPPVQLLAHERERHEQQIRQSMYIHDLNSTASIAGRHSVFSPNNYNPVSSQSPYVTPQKQSGMHSRSSASLLSTSQEDTLENADLRYDRRTSRVPSTPHGRPKSYASSRRSSMRGPPHHNPVEIVLPAPLAVHNNGVDFTSPHSRPTSIYDQWTPPLSRTTSRSRRNSSSDEQIRNAQVRQHQSIDIPPVPPVPLIYSASTTSPVSRQSSPIVMGLENYNRRS